MIKVAILIILLLSLSIFLFSEKTITVCGDIDYPPYSYIILEKDESPKIGQEIQGVIIDALKIILEKEGLKVEALYVGNWRRCQHYVEIGDIDILAGAYKTDDREKYAIYTETPFAEDKQAVFVWKEREFKFEKWEDLIGKKVGLTAGFSTGIEFDDFLMNNTIIERVPSRINNYKKLESGRIDFEPNGLYSGLISIHETGYEGKIVPLANYINTENLYAPISKLSEYVEYIPIIEKGIQKLHEDGTIEKLINEHLKKFGITVEE